MKNILLMCLVLTVFAVMLCGVAYIEAHYTREMTVIDIADNTVIVEDNLCGQVYEFFGDGYTKGQTVRVEFFTNHTDSRQDDEIVKVR